jgi:SAM-dependent methyltransferase
MNWNELYERNETPWEKGIPTPVLGEIHARKPGVFRGHILVPGCGLGHDVRWLAKHGCTVVGADIAPLAVEKAQAIDVHKIATYRLADLFNLPPDLIGAFDLVWEHTCLCALDPEMRQSYVHAIRSVLKDSGMVAGVFFINPEMEPGETGPPFGISVEELGALWRDAGFEIVDSWVPAAAYPGREGRERVMILRVLS